MNDPGAVVVDSSIGCSQMPGGCFFESASGSNDVPNAVKYLHGHDGVILGIAPGTFQASPKCQQQAIPGVPAAAYPKMLAG